MVYHNALTTENTNSRVQEKSKEPKNDKNKKENAF